MNVLTGTHRRHVLTAPTFPAGGGLAVTTPIVAELHTVRPDIDHAGKAVWTTLPR
jgi:hypothetical protein